jgi:hypothetical protein
MQTTHYGITSDVGEGERVGECGGLGGGGYTHFLNAFLSTLMFKEKVGKK